MAHGVKASKGACVEQIADDSDASSADEEALGAPEPSEEATGIHMLRARYEAQLQALADSSALQITALQQQLAQLKQQQRTPSSVPISEVSEGPTTRQTLYIVYGCGWPYNIGSVAPKCTHPRAKTLHLGHQTQPIVAWRPPAGKPLQPRHMRLTCKPWSRSCRHLLNACRWTSMLHTSPSMYAWLFIPQHTRLCTPRKHDR